MKNAWKWYILWLIGAAALMYLYPQVTDYYNTQFKNNFQRGYLLIGIIWEVALGFYFMLALTGFPLKFKFRPLVFIFVFLPFFLLTAHFGYSLFGQPLFRLPEWTRAALLGDPFFVSITGAALCASIFINKK